MYIHVRKDLLIGLTQGYPFVVHEAWILPLNINASLDIEEVYCMGIRRHWVSTFLNGDVINPSRLPEVNWEAYLRVTSEIFGSPLHRFGSPSPPSPLPHQSQRYTPPPFPPPLLPHPPLPTSWYAGGVGPGFPPSEMFGLPPPPLPPADTLVA